MTPQFDAIIVGSGPAGVSAAFPLLEAGWRVLIVDGGRQPTQAAPDTPYLDWRASDPRQWRTMIGADHHAIQGFDKASPKLRVPGHAYVFDGFRQANAIDAPGFMAVGSLAAGGLSNAWGCGVAAFDESDLRAFPFSASALRDSYKAVAQRVGISGRADDELAAFFGLDEWADEPVQMDPLHARLLARHKALASGDALFRMGRPRAAVLTRDVGARRACNATGNCMWGCGRRALYAATEDLQVLQRHLLVQYRPGVVVDEVRVVDGVARISAMDGGQPVTWTARKVLLAAGTLASSRLAMQALNMRRNDRLQSSPTAAFMLWMPAMLGQPRADAFGLSQLAFTVQAGAGVSGYGGLFNPTGIAMAEFVRHVPLARRNGAQLLSALLGSCSIGNLFLPGTLTTTSMTLTPSGHLDISGQLHADVAQRMREAGRILKARFLKRGAWMLPGSFTLGQPGSDIHYAASFPMAANPAPGQTTPEGELFGLPGVHVVDGASLSYLPEKPHTLTIMANADRIARGLAKPTLS
ncbi:MAG: hypothetical protein QM749_19440 [Aquabacterium sp.]